LQQIAPEVWLPSTDQFIFRAWSRDTGSPWTFRVPRAALEALYSGRAQSPQALFDLYRPKIYAAAARLAETGTARCHQAIVEIDIA
jgi:hypothetical protein